MPIESKRSVIPLLLIVGGVVLLIAAGVFIFYPDLVGGQASNQGTIEEIYPQVKRLSLAQTKEAYDANAAVFVDVRDPTYYQASHIPGALSIPLNEIETRYPELDSNQWVILYCT